MEQMTARLIKALTCNRRIHSELTPVQVARQLIRNDLTRLRRGG